MPITKLYLDDGNQFAVFDIVGAASASPPSGAGYVQVTYVGDWGSSGSSGISEISLYMPSIFNVSGSPMTSDGSFTVTLNNQLGNLVFASPVGSSGTPTFRSLVSGDIPDLSGTYLIAGASSGFIPSSAASSFMPASSTFVNSVSATSPVSSTGGLSPVISIPAASTSTNGYLSSDDWNTFNSKQPSGSYLTSEADTLQSVLTRGASSTVPMILTSSGATSTPFTIISASGQSDALVNISSSSGSSGDLLKIYNNGAIKVGPHSSAGTDAQAVNIIYGTSAPPDASGYAEGTIYIQYT